MNDDNQSYVDYVSSPTKLRWSCTRAAITQIFNKQVIGAMQLKPIEYLCLENAGYVERVVIRLLRSIVFGGSIELSPL